MTLRVTVSGANRNPFKGAVGQRAVRAWAAETGPLVRDALRKAAPVGQGPGAGRLRDSINYRQASRAGGTVLTYTSNVPYAGFVLEGTRPHEIRPKRARALRWQAQGGPVFARLVNHPGTRPNRFPERAIRPLLPQIQRRFREIVTEQMRG